MTKREVTEQDFRMPEYRDANPEDYEFRTDGKLVRKDRWEIGIRAIVGILGLSRDDFEVNDTVEIVREMHKAVDKSFAMNKALKDIIKEFEINFMFDGIIADEPDIVIATMYRYAKEGLKEIKEE